MGSDAEDDGGLAMPDREVETVRDLITSYHRGRGQICVGVPATAKRGCGPDKSGRVVQ